MAWYSLRSWFGGNATNQRTGEQLNTPSQYTTESAKPVTEDTALQVSAVWACIRLLSETVASLPIKVMRKEGDSWVEEEDHWLAQLLESPNGFMTSQEYRETQMLNLCLHGNAYAEIIEGAGGVKSLKPLAASQMRVDMVDGEPVYTFTTDKETRVMSYRRIHHIKLFGNGVMGMSPLSYARNTIGLASAAEEYGHNFYTKGGRPSGVLTVDQLLTKEQRAAINERMQSSVLTSGKSGSLMVLEAGFKYQQVQMNPDDLQMIQTRRFQLEDIARFFGVPSFLINDTEKTTTWGSGIEQMMIGFHQLNLNPYLTRWEQSIKKNLLSPAERRKYKVQFDFSELLRGDSKGRAEYLSKMTQNGLMTRNEARKLEGLSPVDGGDKLTAQVNLTTLDKIGEEVETNKFGEK